MRFTASEIAALTNGTVHGDSATVVHGATQDSRNVEPGNLFVPLVAERDGHDFVGSALESGAAAYLTHEPPVGGVAIRVDDTMAALRRVALAARTRLDGPVIGITGSVGKTSTKDLLTGALRQTMTTHASVQSFNNEIGVPLTLINAPEESAAAVVEMGSRGIGHVAELCEIASPTIGIITTVAAAHTGEFGSVENIAKAKGELVEALPRNGLAVLNGDNAYALAMADRTDAPVLTFGTDPSCAVYVRKIELDDELRATFTIDTEWGIVRATPPTRGAHMATNVAAAVGTALWLGLSIADVEAGLTASAVSPWRMEIAHTPAGALVINDSYNANPTSMRGALDSLTRLRQRRKIAIVGYMSELGDSEADEHRGIAADIHAAGVELIAVGTDLYGVDPVDDPLAVLDAESIGSDTAILVKGSRSAGLERLAQALIGRNAETSG